MEMIFKNDMAEHLAECSVINIKQ